MRNEKGSIMALALIGLLVGTVLLIPFCRLASSKTFASSIQSNELAEKHAAEAGVEDAIWKLQYNNLGSQLPTPGSTVSYPLVYEINNMPIAVTVTKAHCVIASDDFESGDWAGGTGWLEDWQYSGLSEVTSSGMPQQDIYHLMLNGTTDYVERSFDFTEAKDGIARLYFWAKVKSFQDGETVSLLVSINGTDWTTLETWDNGDDDNAYRFHDVDLTPYTDSPQLWLAFEAGMTGPNSYFYVDDISVVRKLKGSVLATVRDDFESGDVLGGYHWLGGWALSGSASITPRDPYEGKYHLEMRGPSSYAERDTDLSDFESAKIQLNAQMSHFDIADTVDLRVTGDGTNWYSLIRWTVDDSDWLYHASEVDIPPECLTDQFRIAFYTNLSSSSEFIDFDDLAILGSAYGYEIVSVAGNTTATALVSMIAGKAVVVSWRVDRSTS